ncbi:MAG: hypothetical protein KGN80_07590 [Acidobacteriota bacterium]|nr:hypothetical protein [Acidobacteriota bacterium]
MIHRAVFLLLLSGGGLAAQDVYFKEPTRKWWLPTWELNAWHEDVDRGPGKPAIIRDRSRLRLRWQIGEEDDWLQLRLGSAHYAGSDGNRNNLARFDNEPSNGSRLDLADVRIQGLGAKGGAELHGGLVENGLISTESLWDPDLRVMGGFGRAFLRSPDGFFDEIGLRATVGTARLLEGGRVDITAVQGIAKFTLGPTSWTFFGGPWNLKAREEDLAKFHRQNPITDPDYYTPETHFPLTTYGIAISASTGLPFEIKAIRHINRDTKEAGGELQVFLGGRTRKWRPQVGWVRQILAPTSQLASINGDLWWFHANADGSRYLLALPLPNKWLIQYSYLDQRLRSSSTSLTTQRFDLIKRF